MQSIVLHVDGSGQAWALAKCRICGQVHKYLLAEALKGVRCKSCKHPMEIDGAVIDAATSGKPVAPKPGDGADATS